MKNRMLLLSGLVFILSVTSCSRVFLESVEFDKEVDFSQYKSFEFYKVDIENQTTLAPQEDNIEEILSAINKEMSQKGLLKKKGADLIINIGITMTEEVTTRETTLLDAPAYMGQRNYTWKSEEIVVDRYELGTVHVDVVDSDKKEMIWTASARGVINQDKKDKMKERIDEGVKKMFDKYPVSNSGN